MVKCERCGSPWEWKSAEGVLGYNCLCNDCHELIRGIVSSVQQRILRLPEQEVITLLGFAIKLGQKLEIDNEHKDKR